MGLKLGFDKDIYISKQSEHIKNRINQFGGKLYLEFGGKLFDDYHASRVLPGFSPDIKVQMLKKMADKVEIVMVINASDIEKSKMRSDLGITYDADILRLYDAFTGIGLYVGSVVIAQFSGQPAAQKFKRKLEDLGIRVFLHYPIEGYPLNVKHIVSEEGLGKNDYIETTRPLVVITAPGPGSGKMATCLSQLYHEHKRGISAGYAKFETFPIWNIPLKHPVNLAYEAATADLNDINMIDPFHLEAYGETAVNYNRDVEIFPVLNAIFEKIAGKSPYKSPTDMGVNMAGYAIVDNDIVCKASREEIIRRYYTALCNRRIGIYTDDTVNKIELLMKQAEITPEDRKCASVALAKSEATEGQPAVAIELPDGRIVTGKTSQLFGASSAALLNAAKAIAGIEKTVPVIRREIIEPVQSLKTNMLGNHNPRLHSDETLVALSISAAGSETAKKAFNALRELRDCEAHSTVILAQVDQDTYRKLGIRLTCEPKYQTKKLFHGR